jgi:hypothetical protein
MHSQATLDRVEDFESFVDADAHIEEQADGGAR